MRAKIVFPQSFVFEFLCLRIIQCKFIRLFITISAVGARAFSNDNRHYRSLGSVPSLKRGCWNGAKDALVGSLKLSAMSVKHHQPTNTDSAPGCFRDDAVLSQVPVRRVFPWLVLVDYRNLPSSHRIIGHLIAHIKVPTVHAARPGLQSCSMHAYIIYQSYQSVLYLSFDLAKSGVWDRCSWGKVERWEARFCQKIVAGFL